MSRLLVLLSMLICYPSHHYFSHFYCLLCIAYACIYGYINSIVGTCQAMVQRESFIFCHYLWNSWNRGLDVFSVATTKCTGLIKPWSNFGLFFFLTCQFFTTAADLLQVSIAFVLKIFSFFDREKVLEDVFDRHCWGAACCSTHVSNLWPAGQMWAAKFKF